MRVEDIKEPTERQAARLDRILAHAEKLDEERHLRCFDPLLEYTRRTDIVRMAREKAEYIEWLDGADTK